jgi:RNA polymerase primary sigma factor
MTAERDFLESRDLKHYLEQIGRFPTLSEEEERALGERIRQGDEEAVKKLIQANLRFVVAYAKKYKGMGLSLLDLINEGNVGLIEAARRFDPDRKVRFISYAVWWIRQAIIHALTQYSRAYKIPQKLSDRISLMKKKRAELKKRLGREPTRDELAAEMGLETGDVEDLSLLDERGLSLSDTYDSDEELEVGSRVSDESEPSVEYRIIKASIERQIRELLEELDEKEATVLKLRYGLDDDKPQTLQEIGDRLRLTRERVRQIETKAMRKLSQSRRLQQLRGYLN